MRTHRTELFSGGPGFTTTMHVVPSTLHQCFKYKVDGDQKKIVGDLKPFSVKESHYAAAKSFVDSEEATSTSTSQSSKKGQKNGSLRVVLSGLQNRLKDPNRGKGSYSGSDDDEVLPKPSPPSQSKPKLPEGVTAPLTMVQVSNVNGSLLPSLALYNSSGHGALISAKSSISPLSLSISPLPFVE